MTMVAAIAVVALTFGLSLLAASCSDDEAAGNGRVAQIAGDGPADGRNCQGGAQGCGAATGCGECLVGTGACSGACDGACDGSACTGACTGTCDGACDGTCAGDAACDPCAEAGGAGPFGDEPICF